MGQRSPIYNNNDSVTVDELAEKAYQAYSASTDNKNFRGEEMPKWQSLPATQKTAWHAATLETINNVTEEIDPEEIAVVAIPVDGDLENIEAILVDLCKALNASKTKSRERSMVITKVDEALLWLGKCIQIEGKRLKMNSTPSDGSGIHFGLPVDVDPAILPLENEPGAVVAVDVKDGESIAVATMQHESTGQVALLIGGSKLVDFKTWAQQLEK